MTNELEDNLKQTFGWHKSRISGIKKSPDFFVFCLNLEQKTHPFPIIHFLYKVTQVAECIVLMGKP